LVVDSEVGQVARLAAPQAVGSVGDVDLQARGSGVGGEGSGVGERGVQQSPGHQRCIAACEAGTGAAARG
jgi:hypothetical protein